MTAPFHRRWFQFSLKSLMATVVVICLGLGGWHLLWTKGQYVEAEPAVVGQPIKIHGSFFQFFATGKYRGYYRLLVLRDGETHRYSEQMCAKDVGWFRYEVEREIGKGHRFDPTDYTMTLAPHGGRPINGKFVVRPAD